MDNLSIFADKAVQPSEKDLAEKLGATFPLWNRLSDYVMEKYPAGLKEWNFPGKKYGWSFRIKDKKRAIIYLLPHEDYFMAAFVFGDRATEAVLKSEVSAVIKNELEKAVKYAEGRGIRIEIKDDTLLPDIKRLVDIKLLY
jgi:hypothetical protein